MENDANDDNRKQQTTMTTLKLHRLILSVHLHWFYLNIKTRTFSTNRFHSRNALKSDKDKLPRTKNIDTNNIIVGVK